MGGLIVLVCIIFLVAYIWYDFTYNSPQEQQKRIMGWDKDASSLGPDPKPETSPNPSVIDMAEAFDQSDVYRAVEIWQKHPKLEVYDFWKHMLEAEENGQTWLGKSIDFEMTQEYLEFLHSTYEVAKRDYIYN